MSEFVIHPGDIPELTLFLRRYVAPGANPATGKSVLLLHGASANHRTFTTGEGGGLAKFLFDKGFDPWLLDWRGSSLVGEKNQKVLKSAGHVFNFNAAARCDIAAALDCMKTKVSFPVAAAGHCMGSTVLSEAIAREHVNPTQIDCAVLLTLGLFYETPIDSQMKSDERVLEQLQQRPEFFSVDPRVKVTGGAFEPQWPGEIQDLYANWPGRLFHDDENIDQDEQVQARQRVKQMCNRVAFMYGMPYHHANLVDAIHGTDKVTPVLEDQFGAIPLHMYLHAIRNIRRGRSTTFDAGKDKEEDFLSPETQSRFHALDRVTLITGALNRLWHRDSIDLMYEWLTRGRFNQDKIHKHVLKNYAHQDLLWGKQSPKDVFELIEKGLGTRMQQYAA